MGWGTSWKTEALEEAASHGWPETILNKHGVNNIQSGKFNTEPTSYQNKIPTHDPYTNPNAFLYYECQCGAVLDPKVKSFASLNNHASNAGWKIRWGKKHYVAYCSECGEGVE